MSDPTKVLQHYGRSDIRTKLEMALKAAGLGEGCLSPADLAPLDQFHTRGMAATIELGAALCIAPGARGIDIGSGLGGPSRYLAAKFDCHVQGVDLSPAFVEAATYLAKRTGLTRMLPTIAPMRWRCPMTTNVSTSPGPNTWR